MTPRPRIEPLGLRREDAAHYIGVGTTKWDELVREGRMPPPVRIDGMVRWDRHDIDAAWRAMKDAADARWMEPVA